MSAAIPGDFRITDETCPECGAELIGSFNVATIDANGVNDFGSWSGCYACLILDYFKGLADD